MLFIDFAFLYDRASWSDFSILSGNLFLGTYSLAGFVVEHAAAGYLDIRLRQKCPFTEYQVYVVVGLAFVVVECADAFHTIPLVKFLCKFFQYLWGVIGGVRFRQGNDQLSCFDALALCTKAPELLLTFKSKVLPELRVCGLVGCV